MSSAFNFCIDWSYATQALFARVVGGEHKAHASLSTLVFFVGEGISSGVVRHIE